MSIRMRLFTMFKGELVGNDEFGNRYYQERGAPSRAWRRRWVMYRGKVEASKVPPLWHAWLHHTADAPPGAGEAGARPWQKPHLPNLTGTEHAYHPPGDMEGDRQSGGVPEPYQAWRPQE